MFAKQKTHRLVSVLAGMGCTIRHEQLPQTLPEKGNFSPRLPRTWHKLVTWFLQPMLWHGEHPPFRAEPLYQPSSSFTRESAGQTKGQRLCRRRALRHFDPGCSCKAMAPKGFPQRAPTFQAAGLHHTFPRPRGRQRRAGLCSAGCRSPGGITQYSSV